MRGTTLTVTLTIIVMVASSSVVAGSQAGLPTSGFVAYNVTLASQGGPAVEFKVNETAKPTGPNGLDLITIATSGAIPHLDYSAVFNASSVPEIFPYLIGLNNQSFDYSARGFQISAHVLRVGGTSITFNGKEYQGQNYELSVVASNSSYIQSYSITGSVVTMPSGLVYFLGLTANGIFSLSLQLSATNLQLDAIQQSPSNMLFGFALVGLGLVGAAAVAAPSIFAIVRVRMARVKSDNPPAPSVEPASNTSPPDKPDYWVD